LFGLLGIIFYLAQGVIAFTIQNIINYIQHYGLKRRPLEDGRYERFSAAHAWSCNFLLSNIISFNFPHHADHHLHPRRPYYLLQHLSESPQMPMGYFGMFFLALIPPLWFKTMNQCILAYFDDNSNKKEALER
jgi:alkane 1-monooxygenase